MSSICQLCSSADLHARAAELMRELPDALIDDELQLPPGSVQAHFASHVAPAPSPAQVTSKPPNKVKLALQAMKKKALDGIRAHGDDLDSSGITRRLESYLGVVETILEGIPDDDPKAQLAAIDQARKTCESIAKMHLDIMRAQLDVQVQHEFRQIVMEAINEAAPDVRQRIIQEIQSRARAFGVLGMRWCAGGGQAAEPGGPGVPEESS